MNQVLGIILTPDFAHSVLRVSTPLIFAGMAAVVSEKAGVVNIGIEGMMLSAALAGVVFSAWSHNAFVGLLGAVLISVLMAFILAYFALSLKTNIILSGLSVNIIAKGGTVFVLYMLTGAKGASTSLKSVSVPIWNIPLIKDIPLIGHIFSGQNLLTYLAFIFVILTSIFINHTKTGLRIRAVGESPNAVKSVGINVKRVQYIALLISGVCAGLGGAFLSMGYMDAFTSNMTNGRGFIALAAESMGQCTAWGTCIAALVFGCADSLSNSLQIFRVPAQFVQMIPYVVTLLGITLYSAQYASKMKRQKAKLLKEEAQAAAHTNLQ